MTVHASDLPAHVRARYGLVGPDAPGRKKPTRAGTSTSASGPGRCGTCGTEFPSAKAWEDHAAEAGCTRWDIDLGALA